MRQMGLAAQIEKTVLPEDEVLETFLEHMTQVRGATETSAWTYAKQLRPFLQSIYTGGTFPFAAITARDVEAWVTRRAERCKPGTAKQCCTALRAFFRFLRLRGEIALPLEDAVPAVPHWSLSTVPKYLREEELAAFLRSFNVNALGGLRDRAMALLMATAGLRAGEVAGLKFEDIDWRKSSIRLRATKSRRTDYVPLTREAGEALAAYLQRRAPTETRHMFVALVAPAGRPLTFEGVTGAMRRAFIRCFPNRPARGAHALRHTLATAMLSKGASFKEIADMLRHRHIDTTGIYAKVDLKGLAHAALPWPEVTP
jgi:site-specific recombinase XerD